MESKSIVFKKSFYFETIVDPQEVAKKRYKKAPCKDILFKTRIWKKIGG